MDEKKQKKNQLQKESTRERTQGEQSEGGEKVKDRVCLRDSQTRI